MNRYKRFCTHLVGFALISFTTFSTAADAKRLELDAALGTPVVPAGGTQTAFLRVSLTGFELPLHVERAPANVAIVLDKSGSMQGEKIRQARRAAITALNTLGPDDIVSVITYDDVVDVVVPATKMTDKQSIVRAIKRIAPGGHTALFAGVSKGANEVRKFLDEENVNRVVLLSDGLANRGPSTPSALGRLGASLGKEGMTVTTIGLGTGYNEDLMARLAANSDGNHAFVEDASELARIFELEFNNVQNIVAQGVDIIIHCAPGVRPIRLLGRQAEINGNTVRTRMNQLASEQEKFVVLELEVPAGAAGDDRRLATVDVSYTNMQTKRKDKLDDTVRVAYSDSEEDIERNLDKEVMGAAVDQVANERSKQAVTLRDEGKVEEARQLLEDNADYLRSGAEQYDAPALSSRAAEAEEDAEQIEKKDWNILRKSLRAKQQKIESQQTY